MMDDLDANPRREIPLPQGHIPRDGAVGFYMFRRQGNAVKPPDDHTCKRSGKAKGIRGNILEVTEAEEFFEEGLKQGTVGMGGD